MSITRSVSATADVTITTTTEKVACQLDGLFQNVAGSPVALQGQAQVTTGANTTALTLRIRRGTTIAGTLVGEANAVQVSAVAGSTEDHSIDVIDTPGEGGPISYVLTVQQTAASADGTIAQSALSAVV